MFSIHYIFTNLYEIFYNTIIKHFSDNCPYQTDVFNLYQVLQSLLILLLSGP